MFTEAASRTLYHYGRRVARAKIDYGHVRNIVTKVPQQLRVPTIGAYSSWYTWYTQHRNRVQ